MMNKEWSQDSQRTKQTETFWASFGIKTKSWGEILNKKRLSHLNSSE